MTERTNPKPGHSRQAADRAQMIRVDQAGEYGAVQIYRGQMAVLGGRALGADIAHMARQEEDHLRRFNALMNDRQVRPTLLTPLWHVAGFALGAGTALIGEKAAMACTVAIEEVIEEHYVEQSKALGDDDPELSALIDDCCADEIAHKNKALEAGAEQAPAYGLLTAFIKAGARTAIRIAKRV
ncbi:MAG: demethoxyubiquinone hydroxylase family protein [Alphaproteobacteria bacterium]|nr:MAG: demethoxyubiquinone hydroxylase family protein [Alphaproteobacteria bacterium]